MCFFKGEELALQLAVLVDCSGGRCWMGAARAKGCSFTSVAGGWELPALRAVLCQKSYDLRPVGRQFFLFFLFCVLLFGYTNTSDSCPDDSQITTTSPNVIDVLVCVFYMRSISS